MRKRAQSLNEYAIVIALITLAGIGMQTYIKRGIQGNIKAMADVLALGGTTKTDSPAPVKTGLEGLLDGNLYDKTCSCWHPVAKAYYDKYSGLPTVVKTGSDIYYNITKDGVTTRIGGQDAASGEFTSYDWEGYPSAVYDITGKAEKLYQRVEVEDPVTKEIISLTFNEVGFDMVKGIPVARKADVIRRGIGFSKYKILKTNSTPSAGELAQIKGVAELGLYSYETVIPLKIVTKKSITVGELPVKKVVISREDRHRYVKDSSHLSGPYNTGFIDTTVKGSSLYYFHFTSDADNKTLIGAEDILSRDFTIFDKDGFAETIFKENGAPYSDKEIEFIYKDSDGNEVKGSSTREVTSVTVEKKAGNSYLVVGTYNKYEAVRISPAPAANPLPAAGGLIRTKNLNNDTVEVKGAWTVKYELDNRDSFGTLNRMLNKGRQ